MQKKLNWQLYSAEDRNHTIEEVKKIILRCDGAILNFSFFSDLGMSLCLEISAQQIEVLHTELTAFGNITELDDAEIKNRSKKEWLIFINLHFAKGLGNMKIEIPKVPG